MRASMQNAERPDAGKRERGSCVAYSRELELTPVAPFDFTKSLAFLSGFEPTKEEHTIIDGRLTKAIAIDGQVLAFGIRGSGTVGVPRVTCTLSSDRPLSEQAARAASDRIRFFLSLDDDLSEFYRRGREDPLFAPVVESLFGYHQVKFLTPFENACWAVLAQRVPMPIAAGMKDRLIDAFDNTIEVEGTSYRAFPDVSQMTRLTLEDLTAVVRNQRKAAYLHDVTRAFGEVDESFLRAGPYPEVIDWLQGIRGIGPWSAAFVAIRGLGRMEAIAADKAVMQAAEKVYGRTFTPGSFLQAAGAYGPWQGYWGHYLRVST